MAKAHSHPHSRHYTEANQEFYDTQAATTCADRPQSLERARRIAVAMRKSYSFDDDNTTIMDYACGTGLLSRELAPYAQSILGVDISQNAVDVYNTRVQNQGIPQEEMRAIAATLEGKESELDGAKFNVIVCASAYHHFESIEDVTRVLAFFLKPGGSLLVADIIRNEGNDDIFPDHVHHIVAHKGGFAQEEIQTAFESANLQDFTFTTLSGAKRNGRQLELFIAKGNKN